MIESAVLLEISLKAYSQGLIETNENRYLSQISNKFALGDMLTTQEEKILNQVLTKIVKSPKLNELKQIINKYSNEGLNHFIEKANYSKFDDIVKKEVNTGLLAQVINEKIKVNYSSKEIEGSSFFQVQRTGGGINILFNDDHSFYSKLLNLKIISPEGYDLMLELIASWGITEKGQNSNKNVQFLKDLRADWGRELRDRLRDYE